MTAVTLTGSCLCGDVTYEAIGDVQNFFHCHCSRCRKATGTGHASNILMTPANLKWLSGEDRLESYKVRDAKFFTNAFCRICGSRMPRYSPEHDLAVIPAGSLDVEPGVEPTARIFKGVAAAWSCDSPDLPEFEKYPPRP
ncbi:MAG: GFA family protein [Woeseiaceae bacterium]|nr:GFA family protein [Woeseiaceae bacterium]